MPNTDKLMGLATLGGIFLEKLLLKRFLQGMASLLVLAVIIGALIASLLTVGIYFIYQTLLTHGMDEEVSLLLTSGLTMVVLVLLVISAFYRFQKLRQIFRPQMVVPLSQTAEAFIAGLLTSSDRH